MNSCIAISGWYEVIYLLI